MEKAGNNSLQIEISDAGHGARVVMYRLYRYIIENTWNMNASYVLYKRYEYPVNSNVALLGRSIKLFGFHSTLLVMFCTKSDRAIAVAIWFIGSVSLSERD